MIHVSVMFTPSGETLADVRTLVDELGAYGVTDEAELLDGAHAYLTGEDQIFDTVADIDGEPTVADLRSWVAAHAETPGEAFVHNAEEICVEISSDNMVVEQSCCGEHIGKLPANLYVTINPECLGTCVDR